MPIFKKPFWFNAEKEEGKPVKCAYCGELRIPHAHFAKDRFCSFLHGKLFIKESNEKKSAKHS